MIILPLRDYNLQRASYFRWKMQLIWCNLLRPETFLFFRICSICSTFQLIKNVWQKGKRLDSKDVMKKPGEGDPYPPCRVHWTQSLSYNSLETLLRSLLFRHITSPVFDCSFLRWQQSSDLSINSEAVTQPDQMPFSKISHSLRQNKWLKKGLHSLLT